MKKVTVCLDDSSFEAVVLREAAHGTLVRRSDNDSRMWVPTASVTPIAESAEGPKTPQQPTEQPPAPQPVPAASVACCASPVASPEPTARTETLYKMVLLPDGAFQFTPVK